MGVGGCRAEDGGIWYWDCREIFVPGEYQALTLFSARHDEVVEHAENSLLIKRKKKKIISHLWDLYNGVANITTRFYLARYDWSGKVVIRWSPVMGRKLLGDGCLGDQLTG